MSPVKSTAKMIRTNRWAETAAFIIGVLNLSFHAAADTLRHLGYCLGDCSIAPDGIPWTVVLLSAMLIAPKMLGRTNAVSLIRDAIKALTVRVRSDGPATATVTSQAPGQPEKTVAQVSTPPSGGEAQVTIPVADHPDGVEEGGEPVPVTGIPPSPTDDAAPDAPHEWSDGRPERGVL